MAGQEEMELHLSSLKDMITCPICTEIPNEHFTLPCFHSFCTDCVAKLPTKEETERSGVSCPMCRSFSSKGEMVQNDPLVQSLLIRYKSIEQSRLEGNVCSQCKKPRGIWRCIECNAALCETCQSGHTNLPVCRGHRVINTKDESYADLLQSNPIVHCQKHPKKQIEYNCVTCKKAICENCHAFEHGAHEFNEIEEGVAAAIPEVEEGLHMVVKRKNAMEKVVENLAKKLDTLQTNEMRMDDIIQRRTEELIEKIQAESDALRNELKLESATRAKRIAFEKEEMEYNSASLESMIGWSKSVMKNTRGASLLQELYGRIMPRLRTTLADEDPKLPHIDPTLPVFKPAHTIQSNGEPLIGKIEVQNATFTTRLSFRKSAIPFDQIAEMVTRNTSGFRVKRDSYRLCIHNSSFWLPSPSTNQIMLYSESGNQRSTITLNRMTRPRAVSSLTNETVIIACESGLFILLSNDYQSDDVNGQRLHKGDYCDVYVDGETIYGLEYGHNRVDIFEPNDRRVWERVLSFDLQIAANHHDRILVNDNEIYVGSSLRGDVSVYDRHGEYMRSLAEQIEQVKGSNTLLCAHDIKQQVLVLDNKSGKFQVANTEQGFNFEQMDVVVPWDVCFTAPNTMHVLANNMADNAYIHTFKLG